MIRKVARISISARMRNLAIITVVSLVIVAALWRLVSSAIRMPSSPELVQRDRYGHWVLLNVKENQLIVVSTGNAGTKQCAVTPLRGGYVIKCDFAGGERSATIRSRENSVVVVMPDGITKTFVLEQNVENWFSDLGDPMSSHSLSVVDALRLHYHGHDRDDLLRLLAKYPLPKNELIPR